MMNIWIFLLLQFTVYQAVTAIGCPPPPCHNARKPSNGDVTCSSGSFEETYGGGKSAESGGGAYSDGKSAKSGGRSHGGGKSSKSGSREKDSHRCIYSCNKGYRLCGKSILECPFNVADNPICVLDERDSCEALPRIDFGLLNCTMGFRFQSQCQYMCSPGYNITGSNRLTCGSDGLWSNTVPVCQPVLCPPLNDPRHGRLSCPNSRSFGEDCRYTCDDRYVLNGEPVLTCLENGQWTGEPPECKIGECRPLPFLTHGSLTCTDGWDRGSRCFYRCYRGYKINGGSFTLTCKTNGFWRGSVPKCKTDPGNNNPSSMYYEQSDSSVGDPEDLVAGPLESMDTGKDSDSLGAAGIVSITAVVIILLSVGAGIIVAYRRKKNTSGVRTIPYQTM